jgi:hypothetical protein
MLDQAEICYNPDMLSIYKLIQAASVKVHSHTCHIPVIFIQCFFSHMNSMQD